MNEAINAVLKKNLREYDYSQVYFCKNLGKLRLLRKYLREHPNLDPCKLEDCRKIRCDGLNVKVNRRNNTDFSIGDYLKSFGGVAAFLQVPVYDNRISHIMPAIIYARKCKIEDNHPISVEYISRSRSCEILNRLYKANVNFKDDRVGLLRSWCRRSTSNIEEGLALFEEEILLENRSVAEIYESVKEQLRISLDSLCPMLVVD